MKKNILTFIICIITSIGYAQLPLDSLGWTILAPSADSRVIYVSDSFGNDSNSGLSPTTPLKTIAAGYALLRHNYPDWLLLRRGDSWNTGLGLPKKGGKSSTEPLVISSYGDPCRPRPLLKTGTSSGVAIQGGGGAPTEISNYAIVGLHFYAHTRDPQSPDYIVSTAGGSGITILKAGENILIEDCVIDYYKVNVNVQSLDGAYTTKNVKLRRCILSNSYSTDSHAQGIFTSAIDGFLMEENLFDHNGWHDTITGAQATIFNHNLYLSCVDSGNCMRNLVVRNNIISRASSHGMQMRSGGVADNNLFIENGLAMFNGRIFASQTTNNVVLGGKDISSLPRGMAISIFRNPSTIVKGNIVAHKTSTSIGAGEAYQIIGYDPSEDPVLKAYNEFENNIAYKWRGVALEVGNFPLLNDTIIIRNNEFHNYSGNYMVRHNTAFPVGFFYQNNTYHTSAAANKWFRIGSTDYDTTGWSTATGETGLSTQPISYVDPERDIASYQTLLAATATVDAFLEEAKKQSKCNWRNEYTANAVNDYIRKGFCKTNELPVAGFSRTVTGNSVAFTNSSTNGTEYNWNFGDGSQSTTQNPNHVYSATGTYTVTLIASSFCGADTTSSVVTILSTNISRAEINNSRILIYPNPASNQLNINISSLTGYQNGSVVNTEVFNLLGEKIHSQQVNLGVKETSINLDGNHIQNGLYVIRICIDGDVYTKSVQVIK